MEFPYCSGRSVNWLVVVDQPSCLEELEQQMNTKNMCLEALESTKIARTRGAEIPERKIQKVRLIFWATFSLIYLPVCKRHRLRGRETEQKLAGKRLRSYWQSHSAWEIQIWVHGQPRWQGSGRGLGFHLGPLNDYIWWRVDHITKTEFSL